MSVKSTKLNYSSEYPTNFQLNTQTKTNLNLEELLPVLLGPTLGAKM